MVRHLKSKVDAVTKPVALGPGARRDYVDVRDAADAVVRAGADWVRVDNSRAGRLLGWRLLGWRLRYDVDASVRDLWDTVRPVSVRRRRSPGGDGRRRR
ncbi:hypothetical protein [Streptomyces sp. SAI-129]|uniref:hypothetical protein n=1 Tax=Streptomyces sp. SAI-129 TaxID=3377727 RepID=UPI003C7E3743